MDSSTELRPSMSSQSTGTFSLPKFLANPRRYKPTTAMTFPGLRSKKDIDDVIAYITANQ